MSENQPKQKVPYPFLLFILASIHLVAGVYSVFIFIGNLDKLMNVEPILGYSGKTITFSIGLLIILNFCAGVGIFLRKKWGWWFGSLYLAHSLLRYANAIYTLAANQELTASQNDLQMQYNKFIFRIIINGALMLYYYKFSVLNFFDFDQTNKPKLFFKVIGLAIGVWIVSSLLIAFFL